MDLDEKAGQAGLERLTATEIAARCRAGTLSAEAVARACLDRYHDRDDAIRAWTCVFDDNVLAQARRLDAEPVKGPLHGVPVGIKDVILTRDMPTTFNSPHYQGYASGIDAPCVTLLRGAGAIIFGKNDTVEFAVNGRRARTRNPHDLGRTPGGSSSGSAAAVADFQVPLSLGTQTGGSVIRPASYCGTYAIKPTWNAVPHEGFKVCSASMDTLGWFARSAEDLELLCDVFGLVDDEPVSFKSLTGLRIAICLSPAWDQALPETAMAMKTAALRLRDAGAFTEKLELGEPFNKLTAAHKTIMQSEMRSAFRAEKVLFGDALYPELRDILSDEHRIHRTVLTEAYDTAARCRVLFDEQAGHYDAILTPSTPGVAPEGLENTGAAIFNRIWTLLHTPCINVPGLSGPADLPLGLTLTGRRFSDRKILTIAGMLGEILTDCS